MNKYAHFGHVLHFSGLAYGRHRVQGVKIGGIQSSLLFPYLVPDSFMDLPRLVCIKRDFTRFLLIFRVFLIKQRYAQKPRIVSLYNVCTRWCTRQYTHITELRDRIKSDGKEYNHDLILG